METETQQGPPSTLDMEKSNDEFGPNRKLIKVKVAVEVEIDVEAYAEYWVRNADPDVNLTSQVREDAKDLIQTRSAEYFSEVHSFMRVPE